MKNIILILLALIIISCNTKQEQQISESVAETEIKTTPTSHIMVGEKVKLSDYSLNANNGKTIEKDKLILLDFWATWCGPCIASFPHLEEVQEKYNSHLQILAISDESNKKIEPFLEKKPFDLAFFNNINKTLFKAFGITGRPTSCLLSKDGKFLWIGDSDRIEEVLDQVLKGEVISIAKADFNEFKNYYERKDTNQNNFKAKENALFEYTIQKANKDEYFSMVNDYKYHERPAGFEMSAAAISDVVASLMLIEFTSFSNPRKELDSIFINVKVKSRHPKLTNKMAVKRVLEDLQQMYDFEIVEKHQMVDVLKLKVTDSEKLKTFIDPTEGGGMISRKDDKEEFTRISLSQSANTLAKRIKSDYVVYEGNDENKYSFTLNKISSLEEMERELKTLGISIEKGKSELRFVEIK